MNELQAISRAINGLREDFGKIWKVRVFKLRALAALGERTLKGNNVGVEKAKQASVLVKSPIDVALSGTKLPPKAERIDFDLTEDPDIMAAFRQTAGWDGLFEGHEAEHQGGQDKPEGNN